MKPIYLLKVLNHHANHCAVHIYSGDRRCTCGRDKAIDELTNTQLKHRLQMEPHA